MKLKERQKIADRLIKDLTSKGFTIAECQTLFNRSYHTAQDIKYGKISLPTSHQIELKGKQELLGMEEYVDDIEVLMNNGNKGIFICGYHGLGKSSIVNMLAKKYNAEVVRVQVTEMTSEFDLVGSPNPKTGEFIKSPFLDSILKAKDNPDKKYFLLLDEFTRGRDEALNILYPVLAEKKLIINSTYSDIKEMDVPKNVTVFATGNLHDTGQREVGMAEGDRYNIVEIGFITDTSILNQIISHIELPDRIRIGLVKFYLKSVDNYNQSRILAMSIRTMIEAANIISGLINNNIYESEAFIKGLKLTYYGTSQAMLNPNFKMTYEEMIKQIIRGL